MGDMQRSIRFPDDLAQKIQAIAESEDRTFSYVVVRAMERALDGSRPNPVKSVSEEAPVAASGERIPSRPTPPRGQPKARTPAQFDRAIREGQSTALARQQALNKSKK